MRQNIKLVKYRKYDNGLLLFEHLNAPRVKANEVDVPPTPEATNNHGFKTHAEKVAHCPLHIRMLYDEICKYIESLGDMTCNQLKFYLAYKKTQNFVCIEVYKNKVVLNLKLCPDLVPPEDGFSRDMRNISHWGTGDLQVWIQNVEDFEKAKPLLSKAYEEA